jgi:predicted histidine transporter YuiF (NhaC family)
MDLLTIAMLIVGLLLVLVYFGSVDMTEGVTFKGETDEDKKKALATYRRSMSIILALGAVMITLSAVLFYKPSAISVPKSRIIHSLMVAVALSVLIMTSVAVDQIDKTDDESGKGNKLATYLGVALLPASTLAVVLGSLVVWKPNILKIGGDAMSSYSQFGFDFEF